MLRKSSGTDGLRWHCLHENRRLTAGDLALEGDLQAYRKDLYAGMAVGMPDMRAFAGE